ncbi:MAG: glycosyltransferase [Acidimicrobiales bacterium]
MAAAGSVIVRARDEAAAIGATLSALRRQSVPLEIIVVDSGSTDGTPELAGRWADQVLSIPPGQFSYGGALNAGAAAARCPYHLALSAHSLPPHDGWAEAALRHYGYDEVAAVGGSRQAPDGRPIDGVYFQTLDDVRHHPYWGLSNHASSWRASVWEAEPFDASLVACEDKVWSWRLLRAGWKIAFDPLVWVDVRHRYASGTRALYGRVRREASVLSGQGELEQFGVEEALRTWWQAVPPGDRPRWLRRMHPHRAALVAGRYIGEREGRRRGGRGGGEAAVSGAGRRGGRR